MSNNEDNLSEGAQGDNELPYRLRPNRLVALQPNSEPISIEIQPPLTFEPNPERFFSLREGEPLTVVSGPNNCGKSLLLRLMRAQLPSTSYLIPTNRFSSLNQLQAYLQTDEELAQLDLQWWQHFQNFEQNADHGNLIDLQRVITSLKDVQRDKLFELCGRLLGHRFQIRSFDPSRSFSPKYVSIDDKNLATASAGTRLLMLILGICLDDRFDTVLIDEPEIGLSPRVQAVLAGVFQDAKLRSETFPHLRRVVLATHSHILLDRRNIANNWVILRQADTASLQQCSTIADFHHLQFDLLGNDLEALFLPQVIVVVEGPSDLEFIRRTIELRFSNRRVTVVAAGNDDRIKQLVHTLGQLMGGLSESPFRKRLIAVLDQTHAASLPGDLAKLGLSPDNIVVWPKNGIEYYYPESILDELFRSGPGSTERLKITDDLVSVGTVEFNKVALAKDVVARLRPDTQHSTEYRTRLLDRVQSILEPP
jgi:predicted ATPase